jgi:hypothetical protein
MTAVSWIAAAAPRSAGETAFDRIAGLWLVAVTGQRALFAYIAGSGEPLHA